MTMSTTSHLELIRSQGLSDQSAIVILSSSMKVLMLPQPDNTFYRN